MFLRRVSESEQVWNVVVAVKDPGVTNNHRLLNSVNGNVMAGRIPQEVWAKHNQKVFYRHFVVDFLGDNFLQKLKQILNIISVGLRQFPQQKFNFSDPLQLVLNLVNSPPFICIFCAEERIWQLPAENNAMFLNSWRLFIQFNQTYCNVRELVGSQMPGLWSRSTFTN